MNTKLQGRQTFLKDIFEGSFSLSYCIYFVWYLGLALLSYFKHVNNVKPFQGSCQPYNARLGFYDLSESVIVKTIEMYNKK